MPAIDKEIFYKDVYSVVKEKKKVSF